MGEHENYGLLDDANGPGSLEVWYFPALRTDPLYAFDLSEERKPTISFVKETYHRLGTTTPPNRFRRLDPGHKRFQRYDELFVWMQGEHWSTHGEARGIIGKAVGGPGHTSMSVGDVIHDLEDDTWWGVGDFGFVRLTE